MSLWSRFAASALSAAALIVAAAPPGTAAAQAAHPNIVGLKDCSASREQSVALLRDRPKNFRVLTGEDANYLEALSDGADGGIVLLAESREDALEALGVAPA